MGRDLNAHKIWGRSYAWYRLWVDLAQIRGLFVGVGRGRCGARRDLGVHLAHLAHKGRKKFDRIYLFSPSLCTIDDCPFEDLPEDQKYEELSEAILEGVLEEIKDSGEKVLFIMDDVVNDMKKEARLEKLLCKVLMNRRHQCGSGGSLSVWITTQVYNKVPAPVRKCASQLVCYETRNRMELDSLYHEIIVGLTKMEWYQLCKYVWDKKFQFLFLDTTRPFSKMYHKNFNQLELTTEQDEWEAKMGQ